MRVPIQVLCTYLLCSCMITNLIAADEGASGSVVLDVLETADRLLDDGCLDDALRIAYLVRQVPGVSEDELYLCRRLIDRCQQVAIQIYLNPDQVADPPVPPPALLEQHMTEVMPPVNATRDSENAARVDEVEPSRSQAVDQSAISGGVPLETESAEVNGIAISPTTISSRFALFATGLNSSPVVGEPQFSESRGKMAIDGLEEAHPESENVAFNAVGAKSHNWIEIADIAATASGPEPVGSDFPWPQPHWTIESLWKHAWWTLIPLSLIVGASHGRLASVSVRTLNLRLRRSKAIPNAMTFNWRFWWTPGHRNSSSNEPPRPFEEICAQIAEDNRRFRTN